MADPGLALARARQFVAGAPDGLAVVAGSIFLVGAVRARLLNEPVESNGRVRPDAMSAIPSACTR